MHSRYGRAYLLLAERSASIAKIRPSVVKLLFMKMPSYSTLISARCLVAAGRVAAPLLLPPLKGFLDRLGFALVTEALLGA